MTYHPAILDGPWRGQSYEVEHLDFFVARVPCRAPVSLTHLIGDALNPFMPEIMFDEYTYHIHKMKFGKHCILTASINPAQPSLEDAINLLLTDYAKKAII
jgi:hypothetical protein